jgi:hypothetical protein
VKREERPDMANNQLNIKAVIDPSSPRERGGKRGRGKERVRVRKRVCERETKRVRKKGKLRERENKP